MNFNSLLFLLFLIIAFAIHWIFFSRNNKTQNTFLFGCSLLFYAAWDYRFLSLILFSTVLDFFIGLAIEKRKYQKEKKAFLILSIFANIGLLFVFKYFNFFLDSFYTFSSFLGFQSNVRLLNIVLPVGISFYTFQTLSYTIDVYRGKINATNNWVLFASYVSFFPQLVAGPIERASRILPQLAKKRSFDGIQSKIGIRKIIFGFFKKVVIADSLSPMVDFTFNNYHELSSLALLLGALYFTIQIYCDFSGYSDIAIGVSKLFGINLMENFIHPYFSKNLGEFWKRWHISLTTWFRDYLYFPLGGSLGSLANSIKNVAIVFIISGLWHGANWTYIFWGVIHTIFYIPYFLGKNKKRHIFFNLKNKIFGIFFTFSIVMLSWIFFRSNSILDAWNYISRLFSFTQSNELILNPANNLNSGYYILYICCFLLFDYYLSLKRKESIFTERVINILLLVITLFFVQIDQAESFIYFQF